MLGEVVAASYTVRLVSYEIDAYTRYSPTLCSMYFYLLTSYVINALHILGHIERFLILCIKGVSRSTDSVIAM